jgi:hypothetical protein
VPALIGQSIQPSQAASQSRESSVLWQVCPSQPPVQGLARLHLASSETRDRFARITPINSLLQVAAEPASFSMQESRQYCTVFRINHFLIWSFGHCKIPNIPVASMNPTCGITVINAHLRGVSGQQKVMRMDGHAGPGGRPAQPHKPLSEDGRGGEAKLRLPTGHRRQHRETATRNGLRRSAHLCERCDEAR